MNKPSLCSSYPHSSFKTPSHLCTNQNWVPFTLDPPPHCNAYDWIKSILTALISIQLYLWQEKWSNYPVGSGDGKRGPALIAPKSRLPSSTFTPALRPHKMPCDIIYPTSCLSKLMSVSITYKEFSLYWYVPPLWYAWLIPTHLFTQLQYQLLLEACPEKPLCSSWHVPPSYPEPLEHCLLFCFTIAEVLWVDMENPLGQ